MFSRGFVGPVVAVLSASSILAACSSGGGGGGGGGAGFNPQSKGEALAALSGSRRQIFEAWQKKVLKSCDASAAFSEQSAQPDSSDYRLGIDGGALISANGGSAVFSDGAGFAIVSGYDTLSGTGDSNFEENMSMNGQTDSVKAEAKQNGSHCSVYLYGQLVFETDIMKTFYVSSSFTPGKQVAGVSLNQVHPTVLGASGLVMESGAQLDPLLTQVLQADTSSITLVSQKLGLTQDQTKSVLQVSQRSPKATYKIAGEPTAVWSNIYDQGLIASGPTLARFFSGAAVVMPLEVRLALPQYKFGDVSNTKDQANLKLAVSVLLAAKNQSISLTLKDAQSQGLVAFDQAEGQGCVLSRGQALLSRSDVPAPGAAVSDLIETCAAFDADVESASYASGLMTTLVPQALSRVMPSQQVNYKGWDAVVSKLALAALASGADIRASLDPNNQTRISGPLSLNLQALNDRLKSAQNLSQSKDSVLQMGIRWALHGQNVSSGRISQIVSAADLAADPFKYSAEYMMSELANDPDSSDDQLRFALALTTEFKTEALNALSLANSLNYSKFANETFDRILQRQPSLADLKASSLKFQALQTEVAKYKNIDSVKGSLVGLSLAWLDNGTVNAQGLTPIYSAIDNVNVPFESSTKTLVQALSQSLPANQPTLAFASSVTPEYKQLAVSIRDASASANHSDWGQTFFNSVLQKQPSIDQLRAWNDMWSAVVSFSARDEARAQSEPSQASAKWNRNDVLDLAVKEMWSSADFAEFEAVAAVASSKVSCDHYQSASSLAKCAGISSFSKAKGKFLDPAFNGRYTSLAQDFSGYLAALSGFDQTQMRWSLVGAFFGSFNQIWSTCDAASFSAKQTSLRAAMSSYLNAADQISKWHVEQQVKDTLSECH